MAKKKKIRPIGEIYLELEELIDEMIDDHKIEWGDILHWVFGHLMIHRPDAREVYNDGDKTEFFYGPSNKKKK